MHSHCSDLLFVAAVAVVCLRLLITSVGNKGNVRSVDV